MEINTYKNDDQKCKRLTKKHSLIKKKRSYTDNKLLKNKDKQINLVNVKRLLNSNQSLSLSAASGDNNVNSMGLNKS